MNKVPRFNLENVQLEAKHPLDVSSSLWPVLQRNARAAFAGQFCVSEEHSPEDLLLSALPSDAPRLSVQGPNQRSLSEIDYFVKFDDLPRYRDTLRKPQLLVGNELAADQSISRPSLIIARLEGQAVGHLYVADNVSGATERTQPQKWCLIFKNDRWIREVVVLPEFQHRGIGLAMSRLALKSAMVGQPFSTYAWPLENPEVANMLDLPGVVATSMGQVQPFGPPDKSLPAEQSRYHHRNARRLSRRIEALPGFRQALSEMRPPRSWGVDASR